MSLCNEIGPLKSLPCNYRPENRHTRKGSNPRYFQKSKHEKTSELYKQYLQVKDEYDNSFLLYLTANYESPDKKYEKKSNA